MPAGHHSRPGLAVCPNPAAGTHVRVLNGDAQTRDSHAALLVVPRLFLIVGSIHIGIGCSLCQVILNAAHRQADRRVDGSKIRVGDVAVRYVEVRAVRRVRLATRLVRKHVMRNLVEEDGDGLTIFP